MQEDDLVMELLNYFIKRKHIDSFKNYHSDDKMVNNKDKFEDIFEDYYEENS